MLLKLKPTPLPKEILGIPVKVSARAKHMSLSADPRLGEVVLTLPKRASERSAKRFIESKQEWIAACREEMQCHQVFKDGGVVTVLGKEYTILHKEGRGVSRFEEDTLVVHGMAEHVSRRVKDFLKKYAKEVLIELTKEKLKEIDKPLVSVRVIDPKSRWGSCSPEGVIMFSWRLILTPPYVMDYVVAHEVAHRVHMNHSKRFWSLCHSLTENAGGAKAWLKTHGGHVMGYR